MMNSSSSCFDCAVDPSQYNTLEDMLEVIELLRKRPDIGFLYLSPAVEKNSVHYFYYYLKCARRRPIGALSYPRKYRIQSTVCAVRRVVSYVDILKSDYATISLKGVTRSRVGDETDFTPMERFEYEYRQFHKLRKVSAPPHPLLFNHVDRVLRSSNSAGDRLCYRMNMNARTHISTGVQIGVFKLFRQWKQFSVWRKNVLNKKIDKCKKGLNENLFVLNNVRSALTHTVQYSYSTLVPIPRATLPTIFDTLYAYSLCDLRS